MRKLAYPVWLLLGWAVLCGSALGADSGLTGWWSFDEGKGRTVLESVGNKSDTIRGNFTHIQGAKGSALKFDGFTTCVTRRAADAPRFTDAFTVEAWIAPQAYPLNWCAVVNQEKGHKAGYFFGIDDLGHVGFHVAVEGKRRECTSKDRVPFMEKWSHIVGTFDKDAGITVYIDGSAAATLAVSGKPTFAEDVDLQIGRNHNKTPLNPKALVRPNVNFPASYSFDGIIDEVKLYSRALTTEEIAENYSESKPQGKPPLQWRKLPQLPAGENRFGAVYCNLKFYQEWDALWRVSEHPDVVVTFDEGPYKMVFWRGTNYNMNLVTENGRWVADQSAEKGGRGTVGCCEHMSDKQCRYAHVRIIENHDARVLVHWRYALCDVQYKIAGEDPVTGWGFWADEYYYVYPDGAAVRHFMVHGVRGCSITEPTVLNQPGEKAEDNVELAAVTLANMQGRSRTYSWQNWPSTGRTGAAFTDELAGANICVVNLKAEYKPFYVYEPRTKIIPYGGGVKELREDYSHFPTWNHWPVCQAPSDGRYALAADRVSSSAITSPEPPVRRVPGGVEGYFIMGLGKAGTEELVRLARSWTGPAELNITKGQFTSRGYDKAQRAYVLSANVRGKAGSLEFEIAAGAESPLFNPAFVIEKWGRSGVRMAVNGRQVKAGKNLRFGHRRTIEGDDLIIWMRAESSKPVRFSLSPTSD